MESAIFEVVKAYLSARYHVPTEQINWQSDVVTDLGLNLADLTELTADLEKEFHVKFLETEALYLRTVEQLVNFIAIKTHPEP
jgi:acyl carrier protein